MDNAVELLRTLYNDWSLGKLPTQPPENITYQPMADVARFLTEADRAPGVAVITKQQVRRIQDYVDRATDEQRYGGDAGHTNTLDEGMNLWCELNDLLTDAPKRTPPSPPTPAEVTRMRKSRPRPKQRPDWHAY